MCPAGAFAPDASRFGAQRHGVQVVAACEDDGMRLDLDDAPAVQLLALLQAAHGITVLLKNHEPGAAATDHPVQAANRPSWVRSQRAPVPASALPAAVADAGRD